MAGSFKEVLGRKGARKGRGRVGGNGGKEELLKLRVIPIALQPPQQYHSYSHSCLKLSTFSPKSSALTSFRTSNLTLPGLQQPFQPHAPPATHLPPPTPRHQQPSATFTLRAPLLPSSHLKEPRPKRPAQATLFLPSNLLAPSHTSPWNSNPYDLFHPSIPSVFPLFFHGFTRVLHHFTLHSSLPKCTSEDGPGGNRTPPSPNGHLVHQPQNRSKSTTEATPIRWGSASKLSMFPYSLLFRNEQLRHA